MNCNIFVKVSNLWINCIDVEIRTGTAINCYCIKVKLSVVFFLNIHILSLYWLNEINIQPVSSQDTVTAMWTYDENLAYSV